MKDLIMEKSRWVTVYITSDEIDANLKKGLLEQGDIPCVMDASIYRPRSVMPMYNQIKLNVPQEYVDQAKELLAAVE